MRDKQLKPVYFLLREGDSWQGWHDGLPSKISEFLLEERKRSAPPEARSIYINAQQMHAIAFADGRIWDVRNGWRKGNDWLQRFSQSQFCPWCNWAVRWDADACENCHARYGEADKLPWICQCKKPAWLWHQKTRHWECAGCSTKVEVAK